MNNNYPEYFTPQNAYEMDMKVSSVMKRVYVKMFLGLLVTAFVALFCAGNMSVTSFFAANGWAIFALVIVELGIVFYVSGRINRISSSTASLLFYIFALVNGLMLFPIFYAYSATSIAKTFFITAGVFGAMSVYGYFTSKDLSRWGSILIMCLFGLIICSVVNIFMKSTGFDWLISGLGVLIFIGLTAWDTQQIKAMAQQAPMDSVGKLATLGALSLYLDFINLFLYLLRFFGNRD